MSVITFELKQEHLDLLRGLNWDAAEYPDTGRFGLPYIDPDYPFGDLMGGTFEEESNEEAYLKDAGIIIYGKPENEEEDPFDETGPEYSEEQLEHLRELIGGLYYALDIVLKKGIKDGEIKLGTYKTKNYEMDWEFIGDDE